MSQDNVDYIAALGLKADPFVAVDEAVFVSQRQQDCLARLQHELEFGTGVVLLEGASGSGKTFVQEHSVEQLVEWCVLSLSGGASVTVEGVWQYLNQALSLGQTQWCSAANLADAISALGDSSTDLAISPLVLLVDDANQVPESVLTLLFQLAHLIEGEYFRLVLLAPPNKTSYFLSILPPSLALVALSLGSMRLDELKAYVGLRLASVGAQDGLINDENLQSVLLASRGDFARLNNLLSHQLMSLAESQRAPKGRGLTTHIALVSGLLFVMILVFWWPQGADVTEAKITEDKVIADKAIEGRAIEYGEVAEVARRIVVQEVPLVLGAGHERDEFETAVLNAPPSSASAEPLIDGSSEDLAALQVEATSERQPAVVKPSASMASDLALVKANAAKPEPKIEPKSMLVPKPKLESKPSLVIEAKPVVSPDAPLREDLRQELARLNEAESQPSKVHPLRSLGRQAYALQLIGLSSKEAAQQYLAKMSPADNIYLVDLSQPQKPWYTLLKGPYATKQDARAGITQLPPEQQRLKPWIKSLAELSDIELNR